MAQRERKNESLGFDSAPNKNPKIKSPSKSEVSQDCRDPCSDSGCLLFHDFYRPLGLDSPPPGCLSKQQGRRRQLVVNGLTKLPGLPPAAGK